MNSGQQLLSLLTSETACLQQLLKALEHEFKSLTSADISAIELAIKDKNQALANQAEATLSRQRFVATTSAEDSDEGLRQLVASYENHSELTQTYSELTSLARQCRNSNRTNGRLISQKQQQTQNALNIIRQAGNIPSTYSDQGGTITTPSSRSLGKA